MRSSAGVGHSLGTNRTPAAESPDPPGADTEWSLWETRRGSDSADCPTLSYGRYIPLPVFVLPLGPHLGRAHVRVVDGIAAPVAEPASGRVELTAPGTANREGGPTPVAETGIRRILVLAPSAPHRQAAERHAMPGLSPASTGEPPSEKRQATNRLRDERISGGFANLPSFMIASSLDLSCRMEMFASGSPSTRSRSASQPSRISPRSLHIMICPPQRVAEMRASIGVMPRYLTKYSRSFAFSPCGAQANP